MTAILSHVTFEDTKGIIIRYSSTKDRQCIDQKKKDNKTNNSLHNITQKTIVTLVVYVT